MKSLNKMALFGFIFGILSPIFIILLIFLLAKTNIESFPLSLFLFLCFLSGFIPVCLSGVAFYQI